MNPVRAVLERVLRTGELPDDAELRAVVTEGVDAAERNDMRRFVRNRARQIVILAGTGEAGEIRKLINDTVKASSSHVGEDAVAPEVPAGETIVEPAWRPRGASAKTLFEGFERHIADGMTELDLTKLPLRGDVTAETTQRWLQEVGDVTANAAALHQAGHPDDARRLLQRHAVYYAPMLTATRKPDPDDPRALAAQTRRR